MADTTLRTQIEIAAPPERVWEVLTQLDRWGQWNSAFVGLQLSGPLLEGTAARLRPGPRGWPPIPVRLVTVRAREELAWEGGVAGMVVGCHGLRLIPTPSGTRLIHTESFRGRLAPLTVRLLEGQLLARYRAFNRGLRDRCEHRS